MEYQTTVHMRHLIKSNLLPQAIFIYSSRALVFELTKAFFFSLSFHAGASCEIKQQNLIEDKIR